VISLTEDEVRQRLDPRRVITAIEAAFGERFPEVITPARTQLRTAMGVFLTMPCYDRRGHVLGMKLVSVQNNPAEQHERVQATYLLLDPATTAPKVVFSANYLTDLRTAATSAAATNLLAREDVRTLGIFGTGRQARAHARTLPLVRHFEEILVAARSPGRAREFIQEMAAELKLPVQAVSPAECASQADVICACTTAAAPLFQGDLLRPGVHLNLVGSFQPHVREVDTRTIQRARVFVDTYDGALAEAGDVLVPISEGVIGRDHVLGDLHELLIGNKAGRKGPDDITVFKSVGCALADLAAAELLVADPSQSDRRDLR
jgi:ornithine cyclodeaminase/alanine dehydrogenase-like protein (mu-crystallin family)